MELVPLTVGHRHKTVAALTAQGRIGCGFCEEDLEEVKLGPPPPPRKLANGKEEANWGLENTKLQKTLFWPLARTMKAGKTIATRDLLEHVAQSIRSAKEHAPIVKALEATRHFIRPWKLVPTPKLDEKVDKVGGNPTWLGKANWPTCLSCGDPLVFLAQLRTGPGTEIPTKKKGMIFLFLCVSPKPGLICPTWDEKRGANAVVFQPNKEKSTALMSSLWLGQTFRLEYESIGQLPKPTAKSFKAKLDLTLARLLWTAETGGEEGVDDDDDAARPDDGRYPFECRSGGAPNWVQDAATVKCEACKKPMPFLAQIDVSSGPISKHLFLGDSAVLFVFFCPEHERGKMLWQGT